MPSNPRQKTTMAKTEKIPTSFFRLISETSSCLNVSLKKSYSTGKDGSIEKVELTSRVDTLAEIDYLKEGGILQYVLRKIRG
jgi:aconitase A